MRSLLLYTSLILVTQSRERILDGTFLGYVEIRMAISQAFLQMTSLFREFCKVTLSSAQVMTLEREYQSEHFNKLDVTHALGKVSRFTTQLSCHKSATATVS
mgnify:CR=1 FL=1